MAQVFSRWPSRADTARANNAAASNQPSLRDWPAATRSEFWRKRGTSISYGFVVVLLPALLAILASEKVGEGHRGAANVYTILAVAAAAVGTTLATSSRQAVIEAHARFEAIFERAGISMWLEDWTAVGKEMSALRRLGITDMEAYYAGRPDELRALRAKVQIKDVNAFTVEEMRADKKESLIGSLDKILPDTDQTFVQWLVAFARGDRFFRSEAHITGPDGVVVDSLFTAALPDNIEGFANIVVTSVDITGYNRQQANLIKADAEMARVARTSTVGALSASIAHEVNSPLAAVVANAQAALRWLRRSEPEVNEAVEAVDAIVSDATRARDVVARTRAFLANAPSNRVLFDVASSARDANLLVERILRECGAVVHLRAEPDAPLIDGDVIQIQQVFTNLFVNAAQAMAPQSGPKDITVTVAPKETGVRVEVADNGPGIEANRLDRVFDPFHSTKPDGMGMGLAICRDAIEAHGGTICVVSQPGQGATFHFTLPGKSRSLS